MTTGSPADILARVKGLIPTRWFAWVAPYRDAIIGSLSERASWSYGLVSYARSQSRLASAYGIWLDIFSYDFLGRFLIRGGLGDDLFRVRIQATILQERVTRAGMVRGLTILTGNVPWIFEPWNTNDTGAYSASRGRGAQYGSMGYGVGQGGYGSMQLQNQCFIRVWRGLGGGVPNVSGYGDVAGGYGVGVIEFTGSLVALSGVTADMINDLIAKTKPTGCIAWTNVGSPVIGSVGYGMPKRPAIMNSKNNSQNIAII